MYIKKAYLADSYEVQMPFGTFNVGSFQAESANERRGPDSVQFSYCGTRITRGQYRQILAQRDVQRAADSERVQAANADRETRLATEAERLAADRAQRRAAQQEALERRDATRAKRQATSRQSLETRIAWADMEIARAELKWHSERDRLGAIKAKAELELLGL